jgi:hypothetical protein
MTDKWIPEFVYSEDSNSQLPLVKVPKDKELPSCIFISEAKEPENPDDEVDIFIRMFISHETLKEKLHPDILDLVRLSIGLKPLQEAFNEGKIMTESIMEVVESAIEDKNKSV